jgi:hypothetical protein
MDWLKGIPVTVFDTMRPGQPLTVTRVGGKTLNQQINCNYMKN